jgi:hypothetical protein
MANGDVPGAARLTLDAGGTITASDRVIIGAGAALGGSGNVNGKLVVQAGGSIEPGETTDGALVTGDLELGGTFICDITGNATADLLEVHGGVSLSASSELRLRLAEGIEPPAGSMFLIIRNDGDDAVNGAFGELSIEQASSILPSRTLDYILDYRYAADPDGLPNDVALRVVPEPHAMALALLLAGLISRSPRGNRSNLPHRRPRVPPAGFSCRCCTFRR